MSYFNGASGISIEQGNFDVIQGNQTNFIRNIYRQVVEYKEKERTEYDEFNYIQRGRVFRVREVDHKSSWSNQTAGYEELKVERMISTVKIHGEEESFTMVSYRGKDAKKAWDTEFREWSEATCAETMQLFGLNQSNVPFLLFHRELVPFAHFADKLGWFGKMYAGALTWNVMRCFTRDLWLDPMQGTLVRGLEGPECDITKYSLPYIELQTLPSSAELLLREDFGFRYFSQLPVESRFDRDFIQALHDVAHIHEAAPFLNKPAYVSSTSTGSVIAVRDPPLPSGDDDRFYNAVVMPDGRTRFNLTGGGGSKVTIRIRTHQGGWNTYAWLSQATSVFNTLGVSVQNEDLSSYSLHESNITLRASIVGMRVRDLPIYLFLETGPGFAARLQQLESTRAVLHTWSQDPNGRTPFTPEQCRKYGLFSKLYVDPGQGKRYYWPTAVYRIIHRWQTLRGFDPATKDFAKFLGYHQFECLHDRTTVRFEDLTADIQIPPKPLKDESMSRIEEIEEVEDFMDVDPPPSFGASAPVVNTTALASDENGGGGTAMEID